MKIQLALQGGGARIVSLLGAAGAIQELRDEARKSKQLKVTRVMGTSAGAIVGAMIAANVDIEKFRLELQKRNRLPLLEELRSGWGANTRLSLMERHTGGATLSRSLSKTRLRLKEWSPSPMS